MKFKIGDKVRLLDQKGEGFVTEVINHLKLKVEIDGLEFQYYITDIVLINESHEDDITHSSTFGSLKRDDFRKKNPKGISKPHKRHQTKEIDLHMHNLVENYKNMTNGEIVQYQLRKVEQAINNAIQNKEARLILIHGVGEGTLRDEVRKYLRSFDNLDYQDASLQKYGWGATEVIFR